MNYMVYIPLVLGMIFGGLCSCRENKAEALGTLEWDRVNGRAVVSETIIKVHCREGDILAKGDPIITIDSRLQQATVARLKAVVHKNQWLLKQLESGYRPQEIAVAKAELEAAISNTKTMEIEYQRKLKLIAKASVSERSLDTSANIFTQAKSRQAAAEQNLALLQDGYRDEEIQQAKASLEAADAEYQYAREQLKRYTVTAERKGKLDSMPYRLGDKPLAGSVISTILAGEAPWARVYLPATWLSKVKVGDSVLVMVDGLPNNIKGVIRHIQSNASFTPYYTLSEDDRSRLSYVTEIDLDPNQARDLAAGIPLRVILNHE